MFVKYHFANSPLPQPSGCLYDYVVAQNGVFVRAERPGMQAVMMTACIRPPIRGLEVIDPYLRLYGRVVPSMLLLRFLRLAYDFRPRELLAYLRINEDVSSIHGAPWKIFVPRQNSTATSVHPVDPYDDAGRNALIEIHSHGDMPAFFSATDNRDESTGFRIYAVVGRIGSAHPQIAVRVGIYGHFWNIPANWVFELPPFMTALPAWSKAGSANVNQGVAI